MYSCRLSRLIVHYARSRLVIIGSCNCYLCLRIWKKSSDHIIQVPCKFTPPLFWANDDGLGGATLQDLNMAIDKILYKIGKKGLLLRDVPLHQHMSFIKRMQRCESGSQYPPIGDVYYIGMVTGSCKC